MQRTISYIFLFIIFSFLFSSHILAVTPSPTSVIGIPAPGITCGDAMASDTQVQKCCKMPIYSKELINAEFKKNIPIFGKIIADEMVNAFNKRAGQLMFTGSQTSIQPCINGSPSTPGDTNNNSCICISEPTNAPLSALVPICNRINSKTGEQASCKTCSNGGGVWTSLGCFSGNLSEFISQKILGTGVGLAGGISLLCIMFAAFQMQTSSGNAEKVKKAQELLTNCITGLMIIMFSILILKIIGVDILRIPGFN